MYRPYIFISYIKHSNIYHLKVPDKTRTSQKHRCFEGLLSNIPPNVEGFSVVPPRCTLAIRPQTNTTSASLRGSLLAASAARFGPSALKVRSFWMDYLLFAPSLLLQFLFLFFFHPVLHCNLEELRSQRTVLTSRYLERKWRGKWSTEKAEEKYK